MLADREEAKAILFYLFEQKWNLSKGDILTSKSFRWDGNELIDEIKRINKHEPIQYITGKAWFCNRPFYVNRSVLIPRPETEMIVDYVCKQKRSDATVLDVGTGSGCIAISIKLESPKSKMLAIDVSNDALTVARINAEKFGTEIEFLHCNFLTDKFLFDPLDFIVSNPPYIKKEERESMQSNVIDYEPAMALFVPDDEPLIFYRALAEQGKQLLKPLGKIVAEINPLLSGPTEKLFQGFGYTTSLHKDLEGKERMIVALN